MHIKSSTSLLLLAVKAFIVNHLPLVNHQKLSKTALAPPSGTNIHTQEVIITHTVHIAVSWKYLAEEAGGEFWDLAAADKNMSYLLSTNKKCYRLTRVATFLANEGS